MVTIKVVKKQYTKYKKDPLNIIQYVLGGFITILFILSLIPFTYKEYFLLLVGILAVQIIISLFRLRLFNFFLEIILLLFSVIAAFSIFFNNIKVLAFLFGIIGIAFKILAVFISIIDISTFTAKRIYKDIKIFKKKNHQNKQSDIKSKTEFKDAEFKEK